MVSIEKTDKGYGNRLVWISSSPVRHGEPGVLSCHGVDVVPLSA